MICMLFQVNDHAGIVSTTSLAGILLFLRLRVSSVLPENVERPGRAEVTLVTYCQTLALI